MAYVQYSITDLCKQQPLERLLYVSSTSYGKDWISMFHSHSFSEMFYVIEGEGQFCTENASVPIKKNNLIIINPNIMHTEKSLPGNPLTYIVLGIDNLQFQFRDQSHEYYNVYDFSHSRSEIIPLLRMMLEELKQKKASYEQICQQYLTVLLLKILRLTGDNFSPFTARDIPGECEYIKYFIDSHYKEQVSLDTLAKLAHLNKFYLSHIFSEAYGISPINYLLERRILNSKELLRSSDYSVTQIAHMTGFSSPNYFSQSFKKSTGMTPRQFRCSHNW